jgi:hypothetical protein
MAGQCGASTCAPAFRGFARLVDAAHRPAMRAMHGHATHGKSMRQIDPPNEALESRASRCTTLTYHAWLPLLGHAKYICSCLHVGMYALSNINSYFVLLISLQS